MAFLNKSKMAKRVAAMGVGEHPLLKEEELAESEKTAYVEGLVFAALGDDEKVDDSEQVQIRRLAASLKVDKAELKTCFETVLGLKTDEDKLSFAEEIAGVLRRGLIPAFFVADVESLIDKDGEAPEDGVDILNFLGTLLFETREWRSVLLQQKKTAENRREMRTSERLSELGEALLEQVAPFLTRRSTSVEDLEALKDFWRETDFADVASRDIWNWIADLRIGEITPSSGADTDKRLKRKRSEKFWLLMALFVRTYEPDAVKLEEVDLVLKRARSGAMGSSRFFKAELLELAKAYLGEEVAGE